MQTVSRLINTFAPDNYDLTIEIDRPSRSFKGVVTIKGSVIGDTTSVKLHSKALNITSATFNNKLTGWKQDGDELALIPENIQPGKHEITVEFNGKITDAMNGMYPCYYEHEGVKKELIATQFESHYAREVFPCVDEPEAKAVFNLTLITETGVTVLGNMPVTSQKEENGTLVTTFAPTPRMSSYLLAWVVGDLHKKTAHTKSGVEVNVWATKAQPAESLDFGLDIATRTIDFFNEYFETPYPLPKSDHVALPDFSSGAMENWGLITYRETALLADSTTSIEDKHFAATVIAHELSHQWFGNLVTMKWWNDLWLNESFATMMEYVAIDAIEPSWDIWLLSATTDTPSALRRDALNGIQAIQCDVNHPDEIQTLFDPSIVYAKGGRLLRMLQSHIGDEAMRNGLSLYFKKFAYQNTAADDLWSCLSEASGEDISGFMNTWITQPGFPYIKITRQNESVILSQSRFFIGEHGASLELWPIPLHLTIPDAPNILQTESITFPGNKAKNLLLNKGGTAHFLTHYDDRTFKEILSNISSLTTIDRLSLLQNQSLLAQAGTISSAELIPLLEAYRNETEPAVWDAISMLFADLRKFVENDDESEKALRKLAGSLAKSQFDRLGWDQTQDENHNDTKLRSTIVALMLYSEQPSIVEEAKARFSATKIEEIDPELRPNIITAAVRGGDPSVVDELIEIYQKSSNGSLRNDIAAGVTATKDPSTVSQITSLLKDSSVIRPQDFTYWIAHLLRSRYSRSHVWQWFRQNWDWIEKTFSNDSHYDMLPRYPASTLSTRIQLEEFRSFFEPLATNLALRRNIELGITDLKGRVALLERDGDAVRSVLTRYR